MQHARMVRRDQVAAQPSGGGARPGFSHQASYGADKTIAELLKLGQQCSVKLDAQDESQRTGKKNKSKGRPMSDSGTKARFYHAVKDAHMAHLIKVDLKAELFSYTIDEDRKALPGAARRQAAVGDQHRRAQRPRWCSATRAWPILSGASGC
jgi:hypothetical protein